MTPPAPPATLRFLPLFGVALAVRLAVVALGVLFIPVQPPNPVIVFGIGVAGYPADMVSVGDDHGPKQLRERINATSASVIEPWYRWDATWFAYLAERGYAHNRGGHLGAVFPPVMPGVLAGSEALGLNPFWVGLLAANLAGAAGAALFAQVAERVARDRAVAVRAFVLLLAFPTAFFYSAPYHESFGLLFTSLALIAWLDARPWCCGGYAMLSTFARLQSVAIGAAAVADWLVNDRTRHGFWRALVVALGSLAGIALFWGFVAYEFGSPFAGVNAQAHWGRRPLSPLNLWYAVESVYDPNLVRAGGMTHFVPEALVALLVVAMGVRAWLRRGVFWGLVTLLPVAVLMATGTFLSAHRLLLVSTPAFIELADVLRNRLFYRLTVGCFAVAQLVMLNRYVHWQWAG